MSKLFIIVLFLLVSCKEKYQIKNVVAKNDSVRMIIYSHDSIRYDTVHLATLRMSDLVVDTSHSGDTTFWMESKPCPIDTLKGILYRGVVYGSYSIETGYYIAPCGGYQVGGIPVEGQENAPIWIPSKFLRNDEVDENDKLVYKEFQEQYNNGYFTDAKFRKIEPSCIYGLLVFRKSMHDTIYVIKIEDTDSVIPYAGKSLIEK